MDMVTDNFWEHMYDKFWGDYLKSTKNPSMSDFQVWCDDHDLVPEADYDED